MSLLVPSKSRWRTILASRRTSTLSSQSTGKFVDHMKPLGTEYVELLRSEDNFGAPHAKYTALFLSSVTCTPMDDSASFGPEDWVDNLTSPVRFKSATINLEASGRTVLLEIEPHSTLAGPLRDMFLTLSRPCNYVPCQIRHQDSTATFLSAVDRLYQEVLPIDIKAHFSENRQALSGLPIYPWDHKGSYWYESRLSRAWRQCTFPHHSLLRKRTVDSPDFSPIWRSMLLA